MSVTKFDKGGDNNDPTESGNEQGVKKDIK